MADIPYALGFYRETVPSHIAFSAICVGKHPGLSQHPKRVLELGFGDHKLCCNIDEAAWHRIVERRGQYKRFIGNIKYDERRCFSISLSKTPTAASA